MPAVPKGSKVLVSGANGFIAVWVCRLLLEHGFSVRGTVRSASKGAHIAKLFASYGDKFEVVVVEDITKEGAFDEAVKGVDAIEHTASPFHFNAEDPNELILPAVHGTVGILESALKYGTNVKRIVVLSSCASVSNPSSKGVLNESSWNTENPVEVEEKGKDASNAAKYRTSKTLAERAAWKFVEENKSKIGWDLVTLCPPFVFGPVLHDVPKLSGLNTSAHQWYTTIITGERTPEQVKSFEGSWVDVRDVALAHVRSVEVQEAGGKRFILAGGDFVWQDWYDTVNDLTFAQELKGKLKTPIGTPGSSKDFKYQYQYDNSQAQTVLGVIFRKKSETAYDTVVDYVEKWNGALASSN